MFRLTLSTTGEYALRAMTSLALMPKDHAVSAKELGAQSGVPVAYLNKIMRKLVTAGLVLSSKGHGGGFKLAKPPSRIRYLDILEVAGYDLADKKCVFGWGACRSDRPCPMHESWKELNGNFMHWARETTLVKSGET